MCWQLTAALKKAVGLTSLAAEFDMHENDRSRSRRHLTVTREAGQQQHATEGTDEQKRTVLVKAGDEGDELRSDGSVRESGTSLRSGSALVDCKGSVCPSDSYYGLAHTTIHFLSILYSFQPRSVRAALLLC